MEKRISDGSIFKETTSLINSIVRIGFCSLLFALLAWQGYWLMILFVYLIMLFTSFGRVEISINEVFISLRCFPYEIKFRHFKLNNIKNCTSIHLMDYKSLQFALIFKRKIIQQYWVSSNNKGLLIEMNNGKMLFIISNKIDELEMAISKLTQ